MATAPSAFSCRESSKWQPCSRALGRSSRWVWPPSGPAGRLHQVTFSSSHIGPTITEERAAKSVVNHQQEEPMTFSGDDISLKQSLTPRWPPCDLPVTLKCCANELLVACASYLKVINQRPPNDLPVTLPTHSWCVKTLKRTEAFLLIFFFFNCGRAQKRNKTTWGDNRSLTLIFKSHHVNISLFKLSNYNTHQVYTLISLFFFNSAPTEKNKNKSRMRMKGGRNTRAKHLKWAIKVRIQWSGLLQCSGQTSWGSKRGGRSSFHNDQNQNIQFNMTPQQRLQQATTDKNMLVEGNFLFFYFLFSKKAHLILFILNKKPEFVP